jgi:hypothetical protein
MKTLLAAFAFAIAALPAAAVVTLILSPFWRWLESTTAIESIGHSGPAGWCFAAVYILILIPTFGAWFRLRKNNFSEVDA